MTSPEALVAQQNAILRLLAAVRTADVILVRAVCGIELAEKYYRRYRHALGCSEAARQMYASEITTATDNLESARQLSRDMARAGAIIIGLGAAVFFAGEQIALFAVALLTLTPAFMTAGGMYVQHCAMGVQDLQSERNVQECAVVVLRNAWATTVMRVASILNRNVHNPVELFTQKQVHGSFRVTTRSFLRSVFVQNDSIGFNVRKLQDVIAAAHGMDILVNTSGMGAWKKNPFTQASRRIAWSRVLSFGSLMFLCATILSTVANAMTATAVCGGVTSALLLGAYFLRRSLVNDRQHLLQSHAIWNSQRLIMSGLDEELLRTFRGLCHVYENTQRIYVSQDADIESQLKWQLRRELESIHYAMDELGLREAKMAATTTER